MIILEIREIFINEGYDDFEGFKITTDEGNLFIAISNYDRCCEQWGYFIECKADVEDFIGATILDNSFIDVKEEPLYCNLSLETDRGTIDFWVYNSHNGYYTHEAVISIFGKKHKESL